MKGQMLLFDMPEKFYEKFDAKRKKPIFKVPIYENGRILTFWQRTWSEADAKKLTTLEYNRSKRFNDESPVKFGKVKEMKEVKCSTKKCWETDLQADKTGKYKIKKEREEEMTESEKKRCGCYFKPKVEIQRQEIIKGCKKGDKRNGYSG